MNSKAPKCIDGQKTIDKKKPKVYALIYTKPKACFNLYLLFYWYMGITIIEITQSHAYHKLPCWHLSYKFVYDSKVP